MEIIKYTKELKVKNLEGLSKVYMAAYLECIRSHTGELVAKQWRRKLPKKFEIVIQF
jgi:hypothetical protein